MLAETVGTVIDLTAGSLGFTGHVVYKALAPPLLTLSLASTAK